MFISFLFQYVFSLKRWSNLLHCMLEKKEKTYFDKLRIVQLFDVDFNSVLKLILERCLLYHGENQGIINSQTHGLRSGRTTHDALNINKISYDIA